MIWIDNRIAETLINSLIVRKFGRWFQRQDFVGDEFLARLTVNVAAEVIDSVLPKVADCREKTRNIAVQCRIADCGFGLIAIVGENRAPRTCNRAQNT